MTFASISGPWILAGLAALAAALFVLQQLRSRYRDVTVVTTLFWRQVIDDVPVRTLRERFRYPWAYALLLTIASLIWIAVAEPQWTRSQNDAFSFLVLDGSAGMAAGDRFDRAVAQLTAITAALPRGQREVIWSGAAIRPLLGPDEDGTLLIARLKNLRPDAAPASLERAIRHLSASSTGRPATSIVIFGDAPVRQEVLDRIASNVTVKRISSGQPLGPNRGITTLGVAEAASGAWDRVDVLVGAQSASGVSPVVAADLTITLDGSPLPDSSTAQAGPRAGTFLIRDVPAAGGLLTARLTKPDRLALDDEASVRLPARPIVRVRLSPSLTEQLGPVLGADGGVSITTGDADVVIRRAGEAVGTGKPALEFVSASVQPQAFLLNHPRSLESSAIFTAAVEDIGLTQIDAMSLADSIGRTIEVSIAPGHEWRFGVWDELLSDNYNFTHSRAFPLFIANAVRWLSGTKAWYPYVAAGRPLTVAMAGQPSRILATNGRTLDAAGLDLVPTRAGELRLDAGEKPLAVSLLDAAITTGAYDDAVAPASRLTAASRVDAVTSIVLAVLALLSVEWFLYQRGRMP